MSERIDLDAILAAYRIWVSDCDCTCEKCCHLEMKLGPDGLQVALIDWIRRAVPYLKGSRDPGTWSAVNARAIEALLAELEPEAKDDD